MNQTNNGTVILGSAMASMEVARKGGQAKQLPLTLIQSIDEYLKSNFEYQQELLVFKAYIYSTMSKSKERQDTINELLNSDLDSGKNHRYDILVDHSIFHWSNLLQYCQMAVENASRDLNNRSFLAYCMARAGREMDAKKIIVEAEVEAPRNPHLAAIKAFIMKSMGYDAEARASLGIALGQKEILNAWLLKARYCELDRDYNCMREALTQLLDMSPRSLPAYAAMAQLESLKGNRKGAMDWIARGQGISQTYVPFWEFKNSNQ
jgi:hypothetical protein